jgi:hypothetical protein
MSISNLHLSQLMETIAAANRKRGFSLPKLIQLCAVTAMLFSSASYSYASNSECSEAREKWSAARSDIRSKLRRYASCIDGNNGSDDCYSEFRRLKSAQSDFESAISDIRSDCRS